MMMAAFVSMLLASIGFGLIEFAVFLLVDYIVKALLQSVNDKRQHCHIWAFEAMVLFLLSSIIYAVHHLPYLLIILATITFVSAILQYFDLVYNINNFLSNFHNRFRYRKFLDFSFDYEEELSEDSPVHMNSRVHARPTLRREPPSPTSIDNFISPIRNRIESPANFTPKNIARTSTPCSDQSLSVRSKLKTLVGINPYVNLPPGLPNRGNNTCYVNSVVQCLAHTPLLVKSLIKEVKFISHALNVETHFLKKFAEILEQCSVPPGSSDKKIVDNVPFCNAVSMLVPHLVSNPRHGPQQQQDAAEILLWLLNKTNELLVLNGNKPNGPQTRSRLLKPAVANNFKWRNKVVNKLLCSYESNETNKLTAIKNEETSKLKKYDTMHSLSCFQSVAVLSDVSWVKYCRNHATVITELFAGQLAEVRQSYITNQVSFSTQAFHILPVPLVDPRTISGLVHLQDCILAMGSLDQLGSEDKSLHDSVTNLNRSDEVRSASNSSLLSNHSFTDGQYQTILRFPPKCLILQLNRFCFDHDENIVRKIRSPVNILEQNLDLSCLSYDKKNVNGRSNTDYLYDLYGVCVHEGGGNSQYGHYLSLCQLDDGKWYKFDDELVSQVNITYECSSLPTREGAYLLFYKRQADFR
ncbi:ubiquitin carboxyl-terminal hydrolase 8-like [Antedon mediterranea]|uniref:ubiquitin carboxyl-terminal hydrolase 8-like n=1 Tax=Antedon mediterranea TaxID=105859 RepID=UPI003AF99DE3